MSRRWQRRKPRDAVAYCALEGGDIHALFAESRKRVTSKLVERRGVAFASHLLAPFREVFVGHILLLVGALKITPA
jgi:hypothetical protein